MGSIEIRTKQITLGKWNEVPGGGGEKGWKPAGENLTAQTEAKKGSVRSFRRLLGIKPGRKVEITAYWQTRGGEFGESVALEHDSEKKVRGKEVIIVAPSTIEQIAILSAEKGMPDNIRVKTYSRWYVSGFLKGLIIDTKADKDRARKKKVLWKESFVMSIYPLTDQDYGNAALRIAQKLDPEYAAMSLQRIGRDLKRSKRGKGLKKNCF